MLGWIYFFQNGAMPGIIKIGKSLKDPEIRARELRTTGVPKRFKVIYKALYESYDEIERALHVLFAEHRVGCDREFFKIDPMDALNQFRSKIEIKPKYEEIDPAFSILRKNPLLDTSNDSNNYHKINLTTERSQSFIDYGKSSTEIYIILRCIHCNTNIKHALNLQAGISRCTLCSGTAYIKR